MDTYDYFMIVVLAAATIFGFWKGLAWQIASLASLVVSYFVALSFSSQLAPLFGSQAPFNRFVAMLVLYLVCSIVIWSLFRLVGDAIDRLKLREFDRQIGALLGLAKGVLLCVAITLFAVTLMPEEQKQKIVDSKSGMYIAILLDRSHGVMPAEIHEVLHPYIHEAQEKLGAEGDEHSAEHHTAAEHRESLK